MCLAIPSKIVEKEEFRAVVDVCGARREVNLMLLPEEAEIGDFVLVHAGFAMRKVEPESAEEALSFINTLVDEVRQEDAAREAAESPPA